MVDWIHFLKTPGYIKDKRDRRDYKFKDLVSCLGLTATEEPVSISLRENQSPVDSQLGGSCVGHALVNAMECLDFTLDKDHLDLSPSFVYWIAREADNLHEKDRGSRIRTAIREVSRLGAALLSDWREIELHLYKKPLGSVYGKAEKNQILSYYRVSGIEEISGALSGGYPVVGGFSVFSSIREVTKEGVVPVPTESDTLEGGHAVLFTGIDTERKLVEFKNSWGSWFGDSGYGYLPFDFWDLGHVHDCWVVTEREYNEDVALNRSWWDNFVLWLLKLLQIQ